MKLSHGGLLTIFHISIWTNIVLMRGSKITQQICYSHTFNWIYYAPCYILAFPLYCKTSEQHHQNRKQGRRRGSWVSNHKSSSFLTSKWFFWCLRIKTKCKKNGKKIIWNLFQYLQQNWIYINNSQTKKKKSCIFFILQRFNQICLPRIIWEERGKVTILSVKKGNKEKWDN